MALLLKTEKIPRAAIQRLAVYLQSLERMLRDGAALVSSEMLAQACDVNASQIRKDLTYFGEFGVRGVGYNIHDLISSIKKSLSIDKPWNCALAGVGNLGRALLNYREFRQRQYNIIAAFDCDPLKIGQRVGGLEILHTRQLAEYIAEKKIQIGIISTPPESAQTVADHMAEAGIKGIMNYASAHIFTPDNIFVERVDFFNHLYALSFNISQSEEKTV
ncbi:MAG: redox-sensing transcriptional repressor Rex [Deltaproteobacteria bacterium]|jgi:redox-sensing transcriptional repressor|nr:redox-sensing transcriptional repressor Rex [Deltaproteobacteria bacterium]